MVLETVAADVLHQILQVRDLGYGSVTEGFQRVVRQTPLAYVRLHDPARVVRADAPVRERHRGRATGQRTPGILLSHRRAEDRRRRDLDIRQKRLRPVTAVEEYAFIIVAGVIVIPIHQRARRTRSELQCIHT